MSNAWTPGPWKAEPPGYFKNWSVTCPRHDGWHDRATVAVANPGDVAVYSKADAHLIAAAPEIYDFAAKALAWFKAEHERFGFYSSDDMRGWKLHTEEGPLDFDAASAALAKARGEQ